VNLETSDFDTKLSGDRLDLKPKVSRVPGNSG